jgi:hypothetical protein
MKLLIIALAVASMGYCTTTRADCYMRSRINLKTQQVATGPTDTQKIVTPDAQGNKCVLRYRINIDNDWQTAEGVGYGRTELEACARATDVKQASILTEVVATGIGVDTQMVCSDLPEIRVRPVKIGDLVFESETDLHTIPEYRKPFWYKRSQCRMFAERDSRNQNLMLYQGVVCRVDNMPNSKWRVIDKF